MKIVRPSPSMALLAASVLPGLTACFEPVRAGDEIVETPTAFLCSTVSEPEPRLRIVLTEDGTKYINGVEFSYDQISALSAVVLTIAPEARVNIRADESVATDQIKKLVDACKLGGLDDFIFGSITREDQRALNAANKSEQPSPTTR
ncbi:MAG: hypothetical protein P1U86_15310 [Verrucomicrobiales bacterium]|nr:hypothetical protein [Verrucomicrobiales bacterium]